MQVRHRTGLWKMKLGQRIVSVLAFCLSLGTTEAFAAPTFYSTTEPSQWLVATNLNQPDGLPSSFQTSTFTSAVLRDGTSNWIANVASGTNSPGGVGYWTFFVFRQIVSLTGYDPTTANLQFEWAADDSGQVFAERGSWTPKFSLNGGSLINGIWSDGYSYSFGDTVSLTSGFVSGLNTIDFC